MLQLRILLGPMLLVLTTAETSYNEEIDFQRRQYPSILNLGSTIRPWNKNAELKPELYYNSGYNNGQRQNRWQNFYTNGYPYSPFNLPSPNFFNRNRAFERGMYNAYNPLQEIYSYVQEIASLVRQHQFPLVTPPQVPLYIPFPFNYFPQNECQCPADNTPKPVVISVPDHTPDPVVITIPGQTPEHVVTTIPTTMITPLETTKPVINSRLPVLDDSRRIWGLAENNLNTPEEALGQDADDEEPLRPISFDRIVPDQPLKKPVLGVAHGTIQASSNTLQSPVSSVTFSPSLEQATVLVPDFTSSSTKDPVSIPTLCEVAVLKCCYDKLSTKQCFEDEGCGSGLAENPCDASLIQTVLDMFQRYYVLEKTG